MCRKHFQRALPLVLLCVQPVRATLQQTVQLVGAPQLMASAVLMVAPHPHAANTFKAEMGSSACAARPAHSTSTAWSDAVTDCLASPGYTCSAGTFKKGNSSTACTGCEKNTLLTARASSCWSWLPVPICAIILVLNEEVHAAPGAHSVHYVPEEGLHRSDKGLFHVN